MGSLSTRMSISPPSTSPNPSAVIHDSDIGIHPLWHCYLLRLHDSSFGSWYWPANFKLLLGRRLYLYHLLPDMQDLRRNLLCRTCSRLAIHVSRTPEGSHLGCEHSIHLRWLWFTCGHCLFLSHCILGSATRNVLHWQASESHHPSTCLRDLTEHFLDGNLHLSSLVRVMVVKVSQTPNIAICFFVNATRGLCSTWTVWETC